MITPGSISLNALQTEKVRGSRALPLPTPKLPKIASPAVAGTSMPRYRPALRPRNVSSFKVPGL